MSDNTREVLSKISVLDLLVDLRSDPSVSKVVQQLGFVVQYIFHDGKFYSILLVEVYLSKSVKSQTKAF